MKLLITGSNGQVGKALCELAAKNQIDYAGLTSRELDITKAFRVRRAIRHIEPTIVINAAAYTAVEAAEDDAEQCFAVNRDGVSNLGNTCQYMDIPLIHISTDYVFDGGKSGPYVETDATNPLGVYGASKQAGEESLRAVVEQHVIVRVSWVFSAGCKNFVKTMIRLSQQKEELKVVADQRGAPTAAADIARVLIGIALQIDRGAKAWGTYHYCSKEDTNWAEFAQAIIAEVRKYRSVVTHSVVPVKTDENSYRVKRPLNSTLSCNRIYSAFGIQQRSWKPELTKVVQASRAGR